MTPTEDPADVEALADAVATGALPFDVVVSGGPGLPDGAGPALRAGPGQVRARRRPAAVDRRAGRPGSGAARRAGRAIAVHCVTRAELIVALAAWDEVGAEPGDRIEHGAVIPVELVAGSAGAGPGRRDPAVVRRRPRRPVPGRRRPRRPSTTCGAAGRCSTPASASPPAPTPRSATPTRGGPIAAARDRTTPSGVVLGPAERITAERALAMFLTPLDDPAGPPRRVEVGAPADLCLLATPLPERPRRPRRHHRRRHHPRRRRPRLICQLLYQNDHDRVVLVQQLARTARARRPRGGVAGVPTVAGHGPGCVRGQCDRRHRLRRAGRGAGLLPPVVRRQPDAVVGLLRHDGARRGPHRADQDRHRRGRRRHPLQRRHGGRPRHDQPHRARAGCSAPSARATRRCG